jgi:hypothetical protein
MKTMSTQKMKMSANEASGASESATTPSQKPKLKKKMTTKKMKMSADEAVQKPRSMTTLSTQKMKVKMSADEVSGASESASTPRQKPKKLKKKMSTNKMKMPVGEASGEIGLLSASAAITPSQKTKLKKKASKKKMMSSDASSEATLARQKPKVKKKLSKKKLTMPGDASVSFLGATHEEKHLSEEIYLADDDSMAPPGRRGGNKARKGSATRIAEKQKTKQTSITTVQDATLEYAKRLAKGDDSANEGERAQTQEEATSVVAAKQSADEVEKAGILEAARLAALEAAREAGLAEEWFAEDAQISAEQAAEAAAEEAPTPTVSIESESETIMPDREEGVSGLDDATPEAADGHSSPSSGNYVSQDAPMSPPDNNAKKESAFAGFFKFLSPRKTNEKHIAEGEDSAGAEERGAQTQEEQQIAEEEERAEILDAARQAALEAAREAGLAEEWSAEDAQISVEQATAVVAETVVA